MVFRRIILLVLGINWFVFSGSGVAAQEKEGANWFFGGRVHLDFNVPQPAPTNYSFIPVNPLATGVAGTAAISDRNGNLLFFTSGGKIATRQKINGVYQPMPNGTFFSGKATDLLLSEMIVQSPGDSNMYYLFFTQREFNKTVELYRLQVDMRLNNGYGDVVPNSLQLIRKKVGGYHLTAFLHHNNRDTWVMTANYDTRDTILNYLVTPAGIMPPVKTKLTSPLGGSRMKASPNSEMFASSSDSSPGSSEVLNLYEFNRATGVPTYKFSLPNPDWLPFPNPRYPFFSFAFSPNSSKLYVGNSGATAYPNNARVYQYDLNAGTPAQVNQSRNLLYHSTNFSGVYDMQLAINGKLYLYTNPTHLSQINCPDFYGQACNLQVNAVDLNGHTEGISLPTLNQTIFRNVGKLQAQAKQNTICEGDTVRISAFGAGAEQFRWQAANGLSTSSETLANPLVNPTVSTTYRVIGTSTCDTDTAFVKVTVVPKPASIAITGPAQVHTFAEKQVYSVLPATIGSKFNWQVSGGSFVNGQEDNSILVNWGAVGTGTVSVTETNASGCSGERKELLVNISGNPAPIIYNVFTPDNDGKNDAFVIENLKWYPENELRIYNRWGQEVFKSTNYKNTWKAEKLSSGVYYYLFSSNGQSWKGWVEVLK